MPPALAWSNYHTVPYKYAQILITYLERHIYWAVTSVTSCHRVFADPLTINVPQNITIFEAYFVSPLLCRRRRV